MSVILAWVIEQVMATQNIPYMKDFHKFEKLLIKANDFFETQEEGCV